MGGLYEASVDKGCGPACGWAPSGAQLHWVAVVQSNVVWTEQGLLGEGSSMHGMDRLFLAWLVFKLVVDGIGFIYILIRLRGG